jgi:hypothetical protein
MGHFVPEERRKLDRARKAELNRLSLDAWLAEGAQIARDHDGYQWRLGDWWNAGQRWCREHVALLRAPDWTGPSWQALHDCAWVARAFKPSRRREELTFAHHRIVAGCRPEVADAWLDKCVEPLAHGGKRYSAGALKRAVQAAYRADWLALNIGQTREEIFGTPTGLPREPWYPPKPSEAP